MTRWLWIWFLLILTFPVMSPSTGIRAGGARSSAPEPAKTAARPDDQDGPPAPAKADRAPKPGAWGGPLAPVLDRLDWVEGHRIASAELAGQVVLVEFWTFECVNCRRTLPAMKALAARYREKDVRVVSIHTPEFDRERDPKAVAKAVAKAAIDYPVALDERGEAWTAMGNRYWPCLYLLDRNGEVVYRHVGELHEGTEDWSVLLRRIEMLRIAKS